MKSAIKFNLIRTVIYIGILSLFFISNTTVSAQSEPAQSKIIVNTTNYSVLSSNVFIFGGSYSGNIDKKPFTTYFEYKRDDPDLDTAKDREETIKIVRNSNIEESAEFSSSPSLKLSSDYYFRAVGYFNEDPSKKFYGSVFSFRTGFPFIAGIPFTFDFNLQESVPYVSSTDPLIPIPPPDLPKAPAPISPDSVDSVVPSTSNSSSSSEDSYGSGLVTCTDHCNFVEFMNLLNRVIKFIFTYMVVPIAAVMFAYAGFLMVTSGGSSESKTKAKSIFTNAVYGLVLAAAAWLIVKTLLSVLQYKYIEYFFR